MTTKLSKNGYKHYEISNYAKNNMECKHNLHYWDLSPYLSFGPSAHSYDLKKRWWNVRALDKYIDSLSNNTLPIDANESLTKKDNYNEIILNGLRLSQGIDISNLKEFSHLIDKRYLDKINNKWDCLSISDKKIKLKHNGFLFVDEITQDLFI